MIGVAKKKSKSLQHKLMDDYAIKIQFLAYLSTSSYLIWIFDTESFKFPIIVLIRDPNHDLFFKKVNNGRFKQGAEIMQHKKNEKSGKWIDHKT